MKRSIARLCGCAALTALISALAAPSAFCSTTTADLAQIQYNKALALEKNADVSGSIALWQQLLTKYPEANPADPLLTTVRAASLYKIGEDQRQTGKVDQAETTFNKILNDFPKSRAYCANALIGIARIYEKRKDYQQALRSYAKVLSDYSDRVARSNFAAFAMADLKKKVPQIPDDLQLELTKASAIHDAASRTDSKTYEVMYTSQNKASNGDKEAARSDLIALLASPDVQSSYSRLLMTADALFKIKDTESAAAAKAALMRYLEIAKDEFDPEGYRAAKVTCYGKLADWQTVITEAEDALSIYPEGPWDIRFRHLLAVAYDNTKQLDKAVAAYEEVLTRFGSEKTVESREVCALGLMRSGMLLAEADRKDEARVKFQQAIDDYSETPSAKVCAEQLKLLTDAKTEGTEQ